MADVKLARIPTIRRMPTYLHKLYYMKAQGAVYASCTDLASDFNLDLIVVRKDIAMTGLAGHRRYGYNIDELIPAIRRYIGWDRDFSATLVGAGALGSALLGYQDFTRYGFHIETVFDHSPEKFGMHIHDHVVLDIARMADLFKGHKPDIGVICTPSRAAQETADLLMACGIRNLWNFANVSLNVPKGVIVQREVIAGGLAILTAKMKQLEANDKTAEGGAL